MSYHDTKCTRCGKAIMSSVVPTLCPGCKGRRSNGKRLAAENRRRREIERQLAWQEYAEFFGIPLSEFRTSLVLRN